MQKASRRSLRKSTSAGSIQGLLSVRPLSELLGETNNDSTQSEPPATTQPSQDGSHIGLNVFSPESQNAESTIDIAAPQLQEKVTSTPVASKPKSKVRRSKRLQGEDIQSNTKKSCPKKVHKKKDGTNTKNSNKKKQKKKSPPPVSLPDPVRCC